MRFFDMQDNPEQYTDEEFQQMLDDPEMQEFIDTLTDFRQATVINEMPVEKATPSWFTPMRKVAAAAIGVLFLSGIAYAAVQLTTSNIGKTTETDIVEAQQETTTQQQPVVTDVAAPSDTDVVTSPVTYEEAELSTILTAVAGHYGVEVSYQDETARSIRLYFVWNPQDELDTVVDLLNKFDRINIRQEGNRLIVE